MQSVFGIVWVGSIGATLKKFLSNKDHDIFLEVSKKLNSSCVIEKKMLFAIVKHPVQIALTDRLQTCSDNLTIVTM